MSSPRIRGLFLAAAIAVFRSRWVFGAIGGLVVTGAVAAVQPVQLGKLEYQIANWRAEQSLPSNKIMSVVQADDGYIWIGTYEGLVRFDGVKFSLFNSNNVPGWSDSSVTCLYVARDGVLWVGHSSGAISSYQGGKFVVRPPWRNWVGTKIENLGEDDKGDIWVQDDVGHVSRVRDQLVLTPEPGGAPGLYDMTTAEHGGLWVVATGRLSRLRSGHFEPVPLEKGMDSYVHGVCASADGGLWVLSGEQLCKWKGGAWTVRPGVVAVGGTPVRAMIELGDGRLFGGTSDHGVAILDTQNAANDRQLSRAGGFPSDWVLGICKDHENGLWVATGTAGLFRLRQKSVTNLVPPDEWQGRAVLSVSPARDGGFWVGTEGAGLYRMQDGKWINYAREAGIRNPYLWSVLEDPTGELWLGTWGGGVYARSGEQFSRVPGLDMLGVPIAAIAPARQGGLWVGTMAGVMRYKNGHSSWVEQGPERHLRDIRAILEEPDGTLWAGSNGTGLGRFKNGEFRQFRQADGLPSDSVQSLFRDSDGVLWIGTRGAGLSRFKDGRFATVGVTNGLVDGSICHIEDDGLGFLWMSSHGGILRVSKTELSQCADGKINRVSCLAYGLNDGLLSLAASDALQPSGCKTSDGRLVFATDRSLAVIDPRNVKLNTHEPPVSIETLRVGDRELAASAFPRQPIVVQPGQSRIEFVYTGLSFAAPEKVHFKHWLEGLESDWVAAGTERTALYNYLPPGNYIFHVTAANNDNVWNQQGKSLAIVVLPYYWQTLWFRIILLVGLVLCTAGAVWFQTQRRLQQKLERLEREGAIQAERTRIANDMHDDLGSQLTRITMLSETARAETGNSTQVDAGLGLIYDTARSVTRAMDEIVWAVNPKHDTLESLVFYFEKFAFDLLDAAGIRCRLEFPSEFPDWHPGSEVRHNFFLAYKEALNNAVRHSNANTVTVQLEFAAAGCTLVLSDNGCGIGTPAIARAEAGRFASGNGLNNMQRRMLSIHGCCKVTSEPGQGCIVSLFVPVDAPGCTGSLSNI